MVVALWRKNGRARLTRLRCKFAALIMSPDVSLMDILGGARGLTDLASPHLLYAGVYVVTQDIQIAVCSALACSGVLVLSRVMMRQPVRQAMSGLALVILSCLVAITTGRGIDFYLPQILRATLWGVFLLLSLVGRHPFVGILVGPVIGGTAWRRDRRLLRTYRQCTAVWAAAIGLRTAVHVPLYLSNNVVALGIAHLLMGVPLFAVMVFVNLRILRRGYSDFRGGHPVASNSALEV
ncbi:DUF3159 domain-containing protein [Nocardia sp. NPDC049190]|uniref:DUF3159 domain-containing protein n=1 Tax=Nocardia sp. NPDC049190 TaxID=3155650 RepID=UPI00340E575F